MTNKYDSAGLGRAKYDLQIGPKDYYNYAVKGDALGFISYGLVSNEIKDMLINGGDFDRDNRVLAEYYDETLREEVVGEEHARFVMQFSTNGIDEDDGLQASDTRDVERAAYVYASDVFDHAKNIFEDEIMPEYESILDKLTPILTGLHSGDIRFDAGDLDHVIVAAAVSDEHVLIGNLEENISEYQTIDQDEYAERIEKLKEYAANLAFAKVLDAEYSVQQPSPTIPGSIEEAAVIVSYIEEEKEYAGMACGSALGSHYIDSRSDPYVGIRIFKDYTDTQAKFLLGSYSEPVEYSEDQIKAKAAIRTFKIEDFKEAAQTVSSLVPAASEKPSVYQAVVPLIDVTLDKIKSGTATVEDYKELSKNRDLNNVYLSNVKEYLLIMHPDIARQMLIQEKLTFNSAALLIAGMIDGSPAAKEKLATLKQEVSEEAPSATKALVAFRKTLYPETPAPSAPQIR